jgi:hypothetical protein
MTIRNASFPNFSSEVVDAVYPFPRFCPSDVHAVIAGVGGAAWILPPGENLAPDSGLLTDA